MLCLLLLLCVCVLCGIPSGLTEPSKQGSIQLGNATQSVKDQICSSYIYLVILERQIRTIYGSNENNLLCEISHHIYYYTDLIFT